MPRATWASTTSSSRWRCATSRRCTTPGCAPLCGIGLLLQSRVQTATYCCLRWRSGAPPCSTPVRRFGMTPRSFRRLCSRIPSPTRTHPLPFAQTGRWRSGCLHRWAPCYPLPLRTSRRIERSCSSRCKPETPGSVMLPRSSGLTVTLSCTRWSATAFNFSLRPLSSGTTVRWPNSRFEAVSMPLHTSARHYRPTTTSYYQSSESIRKLMLPSLQQLGLTAPSPSQLANSVGQISRGCPRSSARMRQLPLLLFVRIPGHMFT
mmetsp:Transcript_27377/g.56864  ORF Transcript_27377/g.56864 Transcript_27377/m.56864 type:complete len:262 (-) Transcript_27377:429-1214(-)